ncbi:DUF3575 domain-containing protein [Flavobacterium sp. UMI-01]|uniref:DUF3575 domain-containing protein n=1 Tax=Flavobacterium sp. UMI-01 TaxID=1441053 RepID=UPI001C7CA0E8|nr:DUF3575 domain-containing protein [Flavobacterium sp. UMI-01]
MRKGFILVFVAIFFVTNAQETEKVSVEKNLYGLQLGAINLSFQYETKLDRKITLLSELGFELGYATREFENPDSKDQKATVVAPYVTLEPRWYYGIDRRNKLGRNISRNSSNFLALSIRYNLGEKPILNTGDFNVVSYVSVIPKYGIRRSFAKKFNYEFSGGVGYRYNIFSKSDGCTCEHNNTVVDIQARIGYNF